MNFYSLQSLHAEKTKTTNPKHVCVTTRKKISVFFICSSINWLIHVISPSAINTEGCKRAQDEQKPTVSEIYSNVIHQFIHLFILSTIHPPVYFGSNCHCNWSSHPSIMYPSIPHPYSHPLSAHPSIHLFTYPCTHSIYHPYIRWTYNMMRKQIHGLCFE